MPETYMINFEQGKIVFNNSAESLPNWVLNPKFDPDAADREYALVSRMGDPEQLHCVIYRKKEAAGGLFSVFFASENLFAATTPSNLDFAAACGFFGEMTANARYGADVFENMELPDD